MSYDDHEFDPLRELKANFPVEPGSLKHLELQKVRRRFYDQAVVDELIELMVSSYDAVWDERAALHATLSDLSQEIDRHKALTQSVGNALLRAEQVADQVRQDAEAKAVAHMEGARAEAEATLGVIRSEHERAAKEVARLHELRDDLRETCRAFVLAQLELIEEHLPRADDPQVSQQPTPAPGSAGAGSSNEHVVDDSDTLSAKLG